MADTLTSLLQDRVHACPDASPIVLAAAGDTHQDVPVTYAQIGQRARAIASYLAAHCAPGSRVLLAYPTGLEFVSAFFGAMQARCIPVPAPPPLPGPMADRLSSVEADCAPALLLTSSEWAGLFGSSATALLVTEPLPDPGSDGSAPATDPAGAAYLQYTSGSTETPKGVIVTHRAALAAAAMIEEATRMHPADTAATCLPNWHNMGLATSVLLPITGQRTVLVMDPQAFAREPMRLLRTIADHGAVSAAFPGFGFGLLLRRTTPGQRASLDLSCWRYAAFGSEAADPAVLEEFLAAFAPAGLHRDTIYGTYGGAETVMMAVTETPGGGHTVVHADRRALSRGHLVPQPGGIALSGSGQPLPGVNVMIVDRSTGVPAARDWSGRSTSPGRMSATVTGGVLA